MNRYKYHVFGRNDREIWVCDACKKTNNDRILMGEWKLIDRCYDCYFPCDVCKGNTEAHDESQY